MILISELIWTLLTNISGLLMIVVPVTSLVWLIFNCQRRYVEHSTHRTNIYLAKTVMCSHILPLMYCLNPNK